MITVRVSTLEAFRLACTTEYVSIQEVQDSILRGQVGGPQSKPMAAGTAWHRALELQYPDDSVLVGKAVLPWCRYGDFWFREEDIHAAARHRGPGLTEVKASRQFDAYGTPVLVTGTADFLFGNLIRDGKTKLSGVECGHYDHSLQWRLYCLIFGGKKFIYDLYDFKEDDGFCTLKEIFSVPYYPYAEMRDDCRRWIARFCDFVHTRKLAPYLDPDLRGAHAVV